MISRDYTIMDPHGMHARPATILLKLSRQYKSNIRIRKEEKEVQMKSMLNILGLGVKCGDRLSVIIDGEDETEAAVALDTFFKEEMK